jgi:hypothetical protein
MHNFFFHSVSFVICDQNRITIVISQYFPGETEENYEWYIIVFIHFFIFGTLNKAFHS